MELFICIKRDLVLNNLQWFIYHKIQPNQTNYLTNKLTITTTTSTTTTTTNNNNNNNRGLGNNGTGGNCPNQWKTIS